MNEYVKILKPVVPDIEKPMNFTLVDFAKAIQKVIQTEVYKKIPDTELIHLLQNAAKIGRELQITQQTLSDYIENRHKWV
jgi:hypothetical protein